MCSRIHMRWGQRGIAILAPICHIVTFVVLAVHPPFPVLIVGNAFSGFGNGLTDACFPAWVGGMHRGSTLQGLLTACYSIGALCAPLVAAVMISRAGLPWYTFYYIMVKSHRSCWNSTNFDLVGWAICFGALWPGGVLLEMRRPLISSFATAKYIWFVEFWCKSRDQEQGCMDYRIVFFRRYWSDEYRASTSPMCDITRK